MAEPFALSVSDRAKGDVRRLVTWLYRLSEGSADRFEEVYNTALSALCLDEAERIARNELPSHIDELGSLAFSAPVYQILFSIQKKRTRRSASGTYRLYYTLTDADKDGKPDTVSVLSVLHAAARPVWDMDAEASEDEE